MSKEGIIYGWNNFLFDIGVLEAAGTKNITVKTLKSCDGGEGNSRLEFRWT